MVGRVVKVERRAVALVVEVGEVAAEVVGEVVVPEVVVVAPLVAAVEVEGVEEVVEEVEGTVPVVAWGEGTWVNRRVVTVVAAEEADIQMAHLAPEEKITITQTRVITTTEVETMSTSIRTRVEKKITTDRLAILFSQLLKLHICYLLFINVISLINKHYSVK